MEDGVDAEDLFGEDGLLKRMKKRMAERILETELTDHLGYEKHAPDGRNRGNSLKRQDHQDAQGRQGRSAGRDPPGPRGLLRSQADPQVPDALAGLRRQDHLHVRKGHEHPQISRAISKISCRVSISPELVSRITDAVTDEALAWQSRPLDPVYPILFLSCPVRQDT